VTFDDGYRNVLTVAVPLLRRHGVPATLFVLTGGRPGRLWLDRLEAALAATLVGRLEWAGRVIPLALRAEREAAADVLGKELEALPPHERERALTSLCRALGDPPEAPDPDRDLMSWDEIRQVRKAGVEIGSHADVHEPLTTRDESDARAALAASRAVLEKELGAGSYPLSYPWGAWTGALATAARAAGFSCALTTDPGVNSADTPLFALRRMLVGADDDPVRLRASLGGLRVARPWGYAERGGSGGAGAPPQLDSEREFISRERGGSGGAGAPPQLDSEREFISRERYDPTFDAYRQASTVDYYDELSGLQEAEQKLFERYVGPETAVLDIGVGAGRTTPHLAGRAARYVGLDYSEAMVRRCHAKFPHLRFVTQDATALGFARASFDVIVFSFNGIDSIPTVEARRQCFRECARVLRRGGVFLFSAHHARYLFFKPVLAGASPLKWPWRVVYAAGHTLYLLALRLPRRAFWRGEGYLTDLRPYGTLPTHASTPASIRAELSAHGFEIACILPGDEHGWTVPWYHYACVKEPPLPLGARVVRVRGASP
jgi:peptidoglycan/xylan/chitin deacetylase (PgdA/CDA1 family)/SAM-dependent methyltransferase